VNDGLDEHDWQVLLTRVRNRRCTPFLGAGASAHVLPTGRQLADRWAEEVGYPLPERDDLARVSQYMAITFSDPLFPKEQVAELCKEVEPAQALQPNDCYDIISELDLPLFVTTNYDDLLLHALQHKRKEPKALLCPWNSHVYKLADGTYNYQPTPAKPAVYYLHGSASEAGSIVLTEDDYLDFIVWVTAHWGDEAHISHIAPAVKDALARTSMLFIGYSQNDWSFRVLMRSIRETGANLRALNIAVQLNPLDDDAAEVDREKVADYLTKYFTGLQSNPVKLYWGTAEAFLRELKERLEALGPKP
jgi:hypothetical protein